MGHPPRPGMPRWLEFMLAILGGLAALIAVGQFVWQTAVPALRPAQKPAQSVTAAPATPGLGVLDASLRTATRHNHILGLIPSGSDSYYLLDVTVANPAAVARAGCALIVEYTLAGGGNGSGMAQRGSGPSWGDKSGSPNFTLPAQPALQTQFFLPSDNGHTALASARVRVRGAAPDSQSSPCHAVDLSASASG